MAKKRKRKNKKKYIEITKKISLCVVLVTLLLGLSYLIFETNILKPRLNELTTSYISFNNKNTTDMLQINNLSKMSDKIGNSNWNNRTLKINVESDENVEYQIIIYKIIQTTENNYIKVSFNNNIKTLDELELLEDGGRVIYQGKINNNDMFLRMWISKEYKDKVNNNSFEIKIRPR